MEFLEHLKSNNEFPIIFIGSGITQRYFKDAPTWDELLQKLWQESSIDTTYFARFDELKKTENTEFNVYTRLAEEIEEKFDSEFYNGKIALKNLSLKKHIKKIFHLLDGELQRYTLIFN
ncbi:hypothetical protein [Ligilactobacillus araffinosus]|uniref:SIR2-like domain-containing protein n=1 Tax=Ligilactobacillus araffinosus DSM 20653 TaxID=1423820 RepID=A0A0R1ZEL5_9LACO|nr:hypothetical protein [Ligilactobacillus araffinosus]KRM53165.1 hypothetical protein FC64_GL000086 [Ligilactobacillus araffinosus DSM 20653]